MTIQTKEDFQAFVAGVEAREGYQRPQAFGIGFAHLSSAGQILDTWFPAPNYNGSYGTAAVLTDCLSRQSDVVTYKVGDASRCFEILSDYFFPFREESGHVNMDVLRDLATVPHSGTAIVVTFIDDLSAPPKDASDVYLRLHLLSHRLVKPNTINLDGAFGMLPNNIWTNEGPVAPEDLFARKVAALKSGSILHVNAVDRFPRMADYVVPSGVRIGDASRVRLGAHLGEGTVVMHEGFCNFNAGTLGTSMVEGRISAGVVVGDQSDIGGGASIMGTLSGGGKEKVVIGRGCLIGANAGTGISLGDLCVIEAGLYITAGTKVVYNNRPVKASSLSGRDGLTFRRNSLTGSVEVLDQPNGVELNEVLHQN
jgi:2,3,4,5-tetrahydropyridine-2,6-dicarboxylate N-succinyltransferase